MPGGFTFSSNIGSTQVRFTFLVLFCSRDDSLPECSIRTHNNTRTKTIWIVLGVVFGGCIVEGRRGRCIDREVWIQGYCHADFR